MATSGKTEAAATAHESLTRDLANALARAGQAGLDEGRLLRFLLRAVGSGVQTPTPVSNRRRKVAESNRKKMARAMTKARGERERMLALADWFDKGGPSENGLQLREHAARMESVEAARWVPEVARAALATPDVGMTRALVAGALAAYCRRATGAPMWALCADLLNAAAAVNGAEWWPDADALAKLVQRNQFPPALLHAAWSRLSA
ncbi:MAG TPA: hypothetical protein VN690_00530 [Terriglobales bacterium]|nr:hypothetical protein [Terriglobales bacterium]